MELTHLTIEEMLQGYRKKTFTPTQVTEAMLSAIQKRDKKLNSYLQLKADVVKAQAKKREEKLSEIDKYPLLGVPIAVKDNFLVEGWQCSAGSKILEGYLSPFTATTVKRLEAAGAIVIGKTNCDEFAMGSSNENSAFGPVRNPWDLERVPGGSSGGSAAALAAGLCAGSLGTDTGGSIRQPASLCGLVGLKPSYGRVSRYGIVAFASSLDQVGPFSRTVWDSARLLEVMGGHDPLDASSSSLKLPVYTKELKAGKLNGKKIGIPHSWMQGVDPSVMKSFESAVEVMKSLGAEVVEIELPHAKYSLSVYYLIAPCEASSNLARYDGIHYGHRADEANTGEEIYRKSRGEGFGREVKMRIMLGTYALSAGYYDAFYLKAHQVRRKIQQDFEKAFAKCDVIVTPTSPTTAFKLGEKTDDPLTMYLSDIFTLPANLAGIAGMSVPSGLDDKGLPIGIQFFGKPFDEGNLFQIAHSYEKERGDFPKPKWSE